MNGPFMSAEDAVKFVKSGDRVFMHGMAAFPQALADALAARAPELRDVEIVHAHTEGTPSYADPSCQGSFFVNNFFIGPNMRSAVDEGRSDYVPVFLSEIPALFRKRALPLDVAMVQVSPPDKHGYCSLGVSVDIAVAAVHTATTVIGQVNPQMPRSHGDGNVHLHHFSALVLDDRPLVENPPSVIDERSAAIGRRVAEIIEDGATLQMGIGGIPNAVLNALTGHRKLGIHTEMFSDGVVDLVNSGVITNEKKKVHRGRVVAGFVSGTRKVYDFINDNPSVQLLDIAYVNDTAVIRKQPKMTAINSAIEIDLTGQVCADSIGERTFSGVGGQMDFVRGASLSEGGKPIFAMLSTAKRGQSRIVPILRAGAGVVTTRAHVHYVVTEYGIADLYGKNLRQRADSLIAIAHPDHRESLEKAAFERFKR